MKEFYENGDVAMPVAVVEKKNVDVNKDLSSSPKSSNTKTNSSPCHPDEKHVTCSSSAPKNNFCLDDKISFESAVNDFNNVVEDVQKICNTNLPKGNPYSITTIQDKQDRNHIFHKLEIKQNLQNHGHHDNELNRLTISSLGYIDSPITTESSDSHEEKELIVNENVTTISEEICSLQSHEGNYLLSISAF